MGRSRTKWRVEWYIFALPGTSRFVPFLELYAADVCTAERPGSLLLASTDGFVRTPDSVAELVLLVTLVCGLDLSAVLDLELLFPGLVLTTVPELEVELRGAVLTTAPDDEEELRGVVVATAFELEEELRDADRTAERDRFTDGVLLTAFFTLDDFFLELLLRTEEVLELLLFDPDFRCASAPRGAVSMAIIIMMIYFFMFSGY